MQTEYQIEIKFQKGYQKSRSPQKYKLDEWFKGREEWKRLKYCRKKKIKFDGDEKRVEALAEDCDFYKTENIHEDYITLFYQPDLEIPSGEVTLQITVFLPKFLKLDIIGSSIIYDETNNKSEFSDRTLKVFKIKLKKNQEKIKIVKKFKNYNSYEESYIVRPLKLLPKVSQKE